MSHVHVVWGSKTIVFTLGAWLIGPCVIGSGYWSDMLVTPGIGLVGYTRVGLVKAQKELMGYFVLALDL